jgi:TrmH family RNA methyltransferase
MQTSGKSGALIIGNEGRGVSDEAMKWVDQSVTIKRIGEAESLNAAISTSILLYEWSKN